MYILYSSILIAVKNASVSCSLFRLILVTYWCVLSSHFQEYKRKLAKVTQVRKELRLRLNNLPEGLYNPSNWSLFSCDQTLLLLKHLDASLKCLMSDIIILGSGKCLFHCLVYLWLSLRRQKNYLSSWLFVYMRQIISKIKVKFAATCETCNSLLTYVFCILWKGPLISASFPVSTGLFRKLTNLDAINWTDLQGIYLILRLDRAFSFVCLRNNTAKLQASTYK